MKPARQRYVPAAVRIARLLLRNSTIWPPHPLISPGNHTCDHAIVTNDWAAEVRDPLRNAQDEIGEMIGITPQSVVYPNGNHSSESVRIGRSGFADARRRSIQQAITYRCSRLKRFNVLGNRPMVAQCHAKPGGLSLSGAEKCKAQTEH